MPDRLTPLDASFLNLETSSAHMHVGWTSVFEPPTGRSAPSFEQLRDHVARRLRRAPRYRQRIAGVPFGLGRPVWVDDEAFDIGNHVRRADTDSLVELADRAMSTPLGRERPLWEMWIAERLDDGRIGLVGKAHHCMVDGIAAVELASLLLDPEAHAPPDEPDRWEPQAAPRAPRLLLEGVLDMGGRSLSLLSAPARLAASPARLADLPRLAQSAGRALAHALVPTQPIGPFNDPISPYRHLATIHRPLEDLRRTKRAFGTTVNDVVLAVSAGGVRSFFEGRGQEPARLKTMVPASVRAKDGGGELGNQISFLFLELPCDEPDPVRRLREIHAATRERKEAGEPEGADAVLELVGFTPSPVQRVMSRIMASPRTFNFVVSNIPGPTEPMYLLGCRLREAYPVVPLADRHAVSIGFTTVAGEAFFGVYADRDALPDADTLAKALDESLDELLELTELRPEAEPVPRA
jgi:diacylglycerol O-acyltransferase / wax synthase